MSFTFRVLTDGWKKNKKQERKQENALDLVSTVFSSGNYVHMHEATT